MDYYRETQTNVIHIERDSIHILGIAVHRLIYVASWKDNPDTRNISSRKIVSRRLCFHSLEICFHSVSCIVAML